MWTYYYKGQATTYQISEDGRVYNTKTKRFLKGTLDKDGYVKIHISCPEIKINKILFLHRMVAETYIPNDNKEKNQVNHRDGNKQNNAIGNLEWVTNKENSLHAWENKLIDTGKQVFCYDRNKVFICCFSSINAAARTLEIHRDSICKNIDTFPAKKTCGYFFFTTKQNDFEIDITTYNNNNIKKKPVGKFNLNGVLLEKYESIKEAANLNHISKRTISDCCHERIKTGKGYIWKFI